MSNDTEKLTDELIKKTAPLVEHMQQLRKQMKAMGLFADDRDLAECEDCQLYEDVTGEGRLFVYRGENYNKDTGLVFEELDDDAVKCPGCGIIFCPYDAELYNSSDW